MTRCKGLFFPKEVICRICGIDKSSHQGDKRTIRTATRNQCHCGNPKSDSVQECTECTIQRKMDMDIDRIWYDYRN